MNYNRALPIALSLIWFFWFFVASLTNLTNFLAVLYLIKPGTFSSTNYQLVQMVLGKYALTQNLTPFIFVLVLIGEFSISFSLLLSVFKKSFWQIAFFCNICWWGLFLVADEIFIAYRLEATHGLLFLMALASWLVIDNAFKQN